MLGFSNDEIATALALGITEGLTDENEILVVAGAAVTVAGDIWCLGAHRLICDDSTDADVVKALLGDAPART